MKSPVKPTSYPKFFAMLLKAALNLGFTSKEQQDEYYRRVCREEAKCSSVKDMPSQSAFSACLKRFAADAGDYSGAIDYAQENQKRTAYVVKVMAVQIMQLKGLDESNARNYFEGVLNQSRLPVGFHADNGSFWLDISAGSLHLILQMLDTHLRRLKRELFPTYPLSFDDRIKYEIVDGFLMRSPVEKWYYSNLPFNVKIGS